MAVKYEKDIGDHANFDCPREPPRSYIRDFRWVKQESSNGTLPANVSYQRYDGRLRIQAITPENAGVYECYYTEGTGEKRSLVTLSVRLSNATIPTMSAVSPAS